MLLLQASAGFAALLYFVICGIIVLVFPLITIIDIAMEYKILKAEDVAPSARRIFIMVVRCIAKSAAKIIILILIAWIVPYLFLWLAN